MRVSVTMGRPGYLVLSDAMAPGWTARVNGAERKVEQANGYARAVAVGSGRSVVQFTYRPASFTWGLWITVVSVLLTLAAGFFLLRTQRKGRLHP